MLDIPSAAKTAELTVKQIFMLFPTPMFTGKLADIGLCDRIEKEAQHMRRAGRGSFSPKGRPLAYMSRDDLQRVPGMKELVDVIMAESGNVLDAMAVKRDAHYITNMWANIANPNRRHAFHNHPNCVLSGLVYIKTPRHCGPTVFASPHQAIKGFSPQYLQKNELNADAFVMPPEKGRMLMWPSFVQHAVEEGAANEAEERIVVAFNIMIRGVIDLPTMRLELR